MSARVVTFYSYKGGTGRTMALANVGWILASNGCRVLLMDWDLEAPGLHRFLGPALTDPEQRSTEGLIDLLIEYVMEAAHGGDEPNDGPNDPGSPAWYDAYTDVMRFAQPINTGFAKGGLEMIGAGRQSTEYAERVNTFDWRTFYARFKGQAFLDAVFAKLRERYDYILIDSRTGVSDTSGICTVHLPDALVVLFTMNVQSIEGASAVALDARRQRADKLDVYPLPTRIELAELDRLQAAREAARKRFDPIVRSLDRRGTDYLENMEVPHVAYYLYGEQLAAIVEAGRARVLLRQYEKLASYVSSGTVSRLAIPSDRELDALRARFGVGTFGSAPRSVEARPKKRYDFYLAFSRADRAVADLLRRELQNLATVFSGDQIGPGQDIAQAIKDGILESSAVVVICTRSSSDSGWVRDEISLAREHNIPVIPVVFESAELPPELSNVQALRVVSESPGLVAEKIRAAMLATEQDGWNANERIGLLFAERNHAEAQLARARRFARWLAIAVLAAAASMAAVTVFAFLETRRAASAQQEINSVKQQSQQTMVRLAVRAATPLKECEKAQRGLLISSLKECVGSSNSWKGCYEKFEGKNGLIMNSTSEAYRRLSGLDDQLQSDCTRNFDDACALRDACGDWLHARATEYGLEIK